MIIIVNILILSLHVDLYVNVFVSRCERSIVCLPRIIAVSRLELCVYGSADLKSIKYEVMGKR